MSSISSSIKNFNNNSENDEETEYNKNDAFTDVTNKANTIAAMSNQTDVNCNNIELEYKQITSDGNGWQRLYQEIREKCEQEANEKHFETSESEKPQNRCLNRYRDVNPYDHSRIIIHRGSIDYINANLVEHKDAGRKYILTQGPLHDTVGHFWLMIWEQNSKAILMLNKLMEKKQIKCHKYWPAQKGAEHALELKDVKLTVELVHYEEYKNFARRWLKLTDLESNTSREIMQFHYTTWPDFGIPSSPVAFLQFLKEVRDSSALDITAGPAVVHCSAGIGRSGTFCLVDCCLVLIDKKGVNNVSVQDVLYELRKYRMGLIQTADQLYFSYQAIIEGIKLLKSPEFNNYKEKPISPIISHNDNENKNEESEKDQECNIDEMPPPLPPRTHSLVSSTTMGTNNIDAENYPIINIDIMNSTHDSKPLPLLPVISNSVSCNIDYLYGGNDNNNDIDNNNANTTYTNENNSIDNVSNRPLPPLPVSDYCPVHNHENSLHLYHETDSDGNEFLNDDQTDDERNDIVVDNNANANNYDNGNNSNANTIKANDSTINMNKNEQIHNENCLNDQRTIMQTINKSTNINNISLNKDNVAKILMTQSMHNEIRNKFNSTETDISKSITTIMASSSVELRRRQRMERQASIEQKIQEIKRKRNETERVKQTTENQHKSIIKYVTAGVIMGVLCVYAYSKWT